MPVADSADDWCRQNVTWRAAMPSNSWINTAACQKFSAKMKLTRARSEKFHMTVHNSIVPTGHAVMLAYLDTTVHVHACLQK